MNEVKIINNSYDYSNSLIIKEGIVNLATYLNDINTKMESLFKNDENKNSKLELSDQTFQYKKDKSNLKMIIRDGNFKSTTFDDLTEFKKAVNDGLLVNVDKVELEYKVSYYSISDGVKDYHENIFDLVFKPGDIKFIRKANHNEELFNNYEKEIIKFMDNIPKYNTIFCSK